MEVVAVAGVVVSFFAGLIVSPLIAIVGERVRDWAFHPEIRAQDVVSTVQDRFIVTRLLVKNEGSVSARDVEAYVEEIFEGGNKRKNFVPVPLRWTHGQARGGTLAVRDIHAKQPSYLDVVDVRPTELAEKFALLLCVSVEAALKYEDLSRLWPGQSTLIIAVYNASGRVTKIRLSVKWDGKRSRPEMKIVS